MLGWGCAAVAPGVLEVRRPAAQDIALMGPRTEAATDALPASLTEIIDAIGIGATLKLAEAFGGIRIYIPREGRLRDGHPLARAIGLEEAKRLARLHAGEFLEPPRVTAYMRAVRDTAIREGLETASAAKIARRFNTTRRNIFRIKVAGA